MCAKQENALSSRDGILGHQLNKMFEYFAPGYAPSLLLADFKENHTLLWL
jgi:hypothetical protein